MRTVVSLGGLACVALVACAQGNMAERAGARAPAAAPAAPRALSAYGDVHEGGTVTLARITGRPVALVIDEDDAALRTVDAVTLEELAVTPLAGTPGQVLARGGYAYVTLRDKDILQVFESDGDAGSPLRGVSQVPTAPEPIALATTPDDAKLLVTSGWGHALAVIDAATFRRERSIDLAREPRAVVTSDDGKKAYVTHVVGGRVSVVELEGIGAPKTVWTHEPPKAVAQDMGSAPSVQMMRKSKSPMMNARGQLAQSGGSRVGCQGFALAKSVDPGGRILAPQTLVETGDTQVRTGGYGSGSAAAEVGDVAVIDEGRDEIMAASVRPGRATKSTARLDCVLPRAAAIVPDTGALLVACLGEDSVVEYDALAASPHVTGRRRWSVGAGPNGIAVDVPGHRAFVWSQFDRTLSVIDLAHTPPPPAPDAVEGRKPSRKASVMPDSAVVRVALSRRPQAPVAVDLALGRKLFHAAGDARIASDGRACASCHPDGRDDQLTWATPEGPRQTPMLAGRLEGTAPYGWLGNGDSVHAHLTQTFQRLRGSGLRGNELDALIGYVATMRAPVAPAPSPSDALLAARGKELFASEKAECASCHGGEGTTDGAAHAVAPKSAADSADTFNTPSLRFVSGTAPYFHDGRYATLRDLLVAPDHAMGGTQHLAPADLDALEAYLRTL